jgi:hypothetical protein
MNARNQPTEAAEWQEKTLEFLRKIKAEEERITGFGTMAARRERCGQPAGVVSGRGAIC